MMSMSKCHIGYLASNVKTCRLLHGSELRSVSVKDGLASLR